MTTDTTRAPRKVDYEDVDDIIGIAAEMSDLDKERLGVDDLRDVARQLDIPDRYVTPAIAELARRRETLRREEARRRQRRALVLWVSVAVVAVLLLWVFVAQGRLGDLASEAARRRSQVVNVQERQQATERQWASQPPSPERSAELSGAENRVRIERMRYDEAVAAYNAAANGFPNSLFAGLFGHPDQLPLSSELGRF